MNWKMLQGAAPGLAAFGEARLSSGVAYLATVKTDGSPRVHPVTPILGDGRLFLFMEPSSPKRARSAPKWTLCIAFIRR